MLPWIELQQIKAYWLQHHAISHTQLHLLFFFFFDKSEKEILFQQHENYFMSSCLLSL